jgi:integrase
MKWLGPRSYLEVSRDDFLAWRDAESPNRKPAGMQLQVASVRSFYAWLTQTGRLSANPCPNMVVRKRPQEPNVPTTAQFLKLRASVQHDPYKSALLELLAGSGLRIDAVLSLRRDQVILANPAPADVDWRNRPGAPVTISGPPTKPVDFIRMDSDHSKNGQGPMIPLTPCAARALRRYMAHATPLDGRVFSRSYAAAYRTIREAGKGVGLKISPHTLRHLYGCLMYYRNLDGKERDPVWVRDAMCHRSIQGTDTYLRAARFVVANDFDWHEIVWHWDPGV